MNILSKILICSGCIVMAILASCTQTHKAYEPTPKNKVIVKNIPELTAFEANCEGNYFANSNQLFRTLFRYLNDNKLAMTIPIEANISPGKMIFIVKDAHTAQKLRSTNLVKVVKIPPRTILSIGLRGRYSQENFNKGKKMLQKYLSKNPKYEQNGAFFAVYWDNPMIVPYFIRKSEINVPVKNLYDITK